MKRLLVALAVVMSASFAVPSFADRAPHNCDVTPPPSGYDIKKVGDSEWKRCYMDSALGECDLGHTIEPIKCSAAIIAAGMMAHYYGGQYINDCHQEAEANYLPAGVTEVDCVKDWACYEDASKCPQQA